MQQARGTVPMYLDHDRPMIDLEFPLRNGSTRTARCHIDTGGGGFLFTETLAQELDLKPDGAHPEGEGSLAPVTPPLALVGGVPLQVEGVRSFIAVGRKRYLELGEIKEAFLPGHLLMRHRVIFDYPNGTFTIATSDSPPPRGVPLPTPISPYMGFPRLEVDIDGERFGLLLDTGASCNMISMDLMGPWHERFPSLPHSLGAVGTANMARVAVDSKLPIMRLPSLTWGPFHIEHAAAVGRPPGTFEQYMSQMMTAPIIGALAGNVLKEFRLEIDYAAGITYVERTPRASQNDMDLVGINIHPEPGGMVKVTGVQPEYASTISPGDLLLSIDGVSTLGRTHAEVVNALRGVPGDQRILVLDRDGEQLTRRAPIVRVI